MSGNLSRRTYHSPRRNAAARETRAAVLGAAGREFIARGYRATTLDAIAQRAGVSLATVKLIEPTKARLLVAAIEAEVRSDDASVPLAEQPWWTKLLDEPEPKRMLSALARRMADALERQADLLAVVWQAAPGEPEIARLEEVSSLGRWADMRTVVEVLAARRALRAGLALDEATDALWTVGSPQAYRLLVRRRGWTPEQWAAWLADSLARLLLVDLGRGSRHPSSPTHQRESAGQAHDPS